MSGPITLETLEHRIVAPLFEWRGTWLVMDADTGACKRHWGANGASPGESGVKQLNNVDCIRLAHDGLLYACDRGTAAPRSSGRTGCW